MTISPVTTSVFAVSPTAQYSINATHPANETLASAINIGDLEEQSTIINVNSFGSSYDNPVTTAFTLNQGDNIFLNSNYATQVDATNTRVQISDSNNNIIADNQGSTAQQLAYTQLFSAGLSPGAGNYTVTATPLAGSSSPELSLTAIPNQGTSLNVNSQLTGADPQEYYNFSLGSGNNLKLAYDANNNSASTRVQIFDSAGNVIADNRGGTYLQQAFSQLTSATGLSVTPGNYTVGVSYADNISTDQNINYNFQLYSGNSYSVVYNTNATAQPNVNTAAASVTPTADAQLYTRTSYHSIKENASTGINIGWIQQNKTSLNVTSLLTSFDNTDYYNFTLQQGSNLKFAFTNLTDASTPLHVQILNSTGNQIIADNLGTSAQQAAYQQITSTNGLSATPGQYVVKVGYPSGASTTNQQQYNFQVFSGTSYSSSYQTTATAENYNTASLNGDIAGGGYNASVAAASYLTTSLNGNSNVVNDITSALQSAIA
jgi:hypothetical protein